MAVTHLPILTHAYNISNITIALFKISFYNKYISKTLFRNLMLLLQAYNLISRLEADNTS